MNPDNDLKQIREEMRLDVGYYRRRSPVLKYMAAVVVVALAVGAIGIFRFGWLDGIGQDKEAVQAAAGIPQQDRRVNVLVVGADTRAADSGRSDTIMVVSFDPVKLSAGVLSIPRDTRVQLPGRNGYHKINTAFGLGGVDLVSSTVTNLLGLRMDYYIVLDFAAFEQVVNAMGGVEVDVERDMHYVDTAQDLVISLSPGRQRLTGKQALDFVRFRDGLGDVSLVDPAHGKYGGRVERQLAFVKAMVREMLRPINLVRLPLLVTQVSRAVQTNISPTRMLSLFNTARNLDAGKVESFILPGSAERIDGGSYWVTDKEKVRQTVRSMVAIRDAVMVSQSENGQESAAW